MIPTRSPKTPPYPVAANCWINQGGKPWHPFPPNPRTGQTLPEPGALVLGFGAELWTAEPGCANLPTEGLETREPAGGGTA
jgi:hypothetical protein